MQRLLPQVAADTLLATEGALLGIDLSGADFRAMVVDLRGNVLAYRQRPIPLGAQAEEIFAAVLTLVDAVLEEAGVEARSLLRAAVAFGGPVDARRGVVLRSHRWPGWESFPLAARLEAHLGGVPTFLENNANAVALGERWFGAGRGAEDLFYLHLSTGIGGGILVRGQIYHGATTTAGEIGHIAVGPADGPECSCGRRGHLEAYASGLGLLFRLQEAGPPPEVRILLEEAGDLTGRLQRFMKLARDGEPTCARLLEEAVEQLARALTIVLDLINPEVVLVGGRLALLGGEGFLGQIVERTRELALPTPGERTLFRMASLGEDSVVAGAIAVAWQSLL